MGFHSHATHYDLVMFGYENDDFPQITDDVTKLFANERAFEKYLLDQGFWFWRQFGIRTPEKNGNQTPDLISRVNMQGKNAPRFNIEVEHAARNFIVHKHSTHNVHLILALWGTLGYFQVKGVPVVAFYRKCPDGMFRRSLEDDLGVIFQSRESALLRIHGGHCPLDE